MKTYRAKFTGRKVGASGIRYEMETTVSATSPDEARIKLYDRYEHIGGLELTERALSFSDAKSQYRERYTCDHIPMWALRRTPNGNFYAPQYASDLEWYENTSFYGECEYATREHAFSSKQTWPLGEWLDKYPPMAVFAHRREQRRAQSCS